MEGNAYPSMSSKPLTTLLWKSNTFSVIYAIFAVSDFDGPFA